jgi:hypothetical protein
VLRGVYQSTTELNLSSMSLRTLPILFFNLGGEMIYILDQRLKAQNVSHTKSEKGESIMVC